MVHLLIVSDIRIYREGLKEVLSRSGRVNVVGVFASPAETLVRLSRAPADAVLIDTGTLGALGLIKAVVNDFDEVRVVAFGLSESSTEIMEYAEAGISGYVPKDSSTDDLIRVLLRAVRGELECPAGIAGALLRRVSELALCRHPHGTSIDLTRREREVAELIGKGLTNKEIASLLQIRVATAKAHVHQVLAKLGARRRGEVPSRLPGQAL